MGGGGGGGGGWWFLLSGFFPKGVVDGFRKTCVVMV